MLIVIAALTPCLMMGVYVFGADMLFATLVCCITAVVLEWIISMLMSGGRSGKKSNSTLKEQDYLAAIVTGALIAFGLPSTIPLWIAAAGAAMAVIAGDIVFKRFAGRIVISAVFAQSALMILFKEQMSTWPLNDFVQTSVSPGDTATGMTPLEMLAEGGDLPGLSRMFVGFISGPCGEVSVAAALIGGAYLIWKRVIPGLIPALVLGTMFIFAFVYYMTVGDQSIMAETGYSAGAEASLYLAIYHLFSGGAVFGALFLAPGAFPGYGENDPYADVKLETGLRAAYAIGVGLIVMIIRINVADAEGIALPVLIMSVIMCAVDSYLRNRQKQEAQESLK